ncbi:MAG: hypothetical protein K2J11_08110 [Oscillospiraceae bacterium]|nr:hypothetical protein [Oscillospiraceae bacterium]
MMFSIHPFAELLNGMRLRAQGGNFALCGARPKGAALWTSASWAQLDQLHIELFVLLGYQ